MIEKGIVTNIEGGEATVSFVPSENCASCKGCACGKDGKTMIMRVKTDRDVDPGDIVTVEVSSRALLSSAFIVFVLPLIVFIIGILSAAPLFRRINVNMDGNTAGIFVGLTLMLLTFALVFIFERRRSRVSALSPRIIAIEKTPSTAVHSKNEDLKRVR